MAMPNTLEAGRYILQSHVGDGPVTVVFRAFDQRERKWRAAKLLQPELARRADLRVQLEHEAHDVKGLSHRNVARVYDAGTDDDNAWLIMGLYERASLAERLMEDGVMAPRQALEALLQVCHGLHAAHRVGVVHGNVKPSNVFVTAKGQYKVADFACLRGSRAELGPRPLDEVAWMAPEVRVDPISADERADVFSVGALLYTLLTGDPPAEDLDEALRALPMALSLIVQKASSSSPGDRFSTVPDLIRALEMVRKTLPDEPAAAHAPDADSDEVAATEEYDQERMIARLPGMPATPRPRDRATEAKVVSHQDRLNREATPADPNAGEKDDEAKPPPLPWVPQSARRGDKATPIGFGRVAPRLDPDAERRLAPEAKPARTPEPAPPAPRATPIAPHREPTPTPTVATAPAPAIGAPDDDDDDDDDWQGLTAKVANTARFLANPARFLILPAVLAFAVAAYVASTGVSTVRQAEREVEIITHGMHSGLEREAKLPDDLIRVGASEDAIRRAVTAYEQAEGPLARDAAAVALTTELEKQFLLIDRTPAAAETSAQYKLLKKRLDRLTRIKREFEAAQAHWDAASQTYGGEIAVRLGLANGPP